MTRHFAPRGFGGRAGAVVAGVRSAWRTPAAINGGLASLLEARSAVAMPGNGHVALALRAARRSLRLLAMVPGGRWRTTCLYRSVAECLAMRALALDAWVAIGVGLKVGEGAGRDDVSTVIAHAWVEEAQGATHGLGTADLGLQLLRRPAGEGAAP